MIQTTSEDNENMAVNKTTEMKYQMCEKHFKGIEMSCDSLADRIWLESLEAFGTGL